MCVHACTCTTTKTLTGLSNSVFEIYSKVPGKNPKPTNEGISTIQQMCSICLLVVKAEVGVSLLVTHFF